jgi:geranylgeranyl pyrophosphate synthase
MVSETIGYKRDRRKVPSASGLLEALMSVSGGKSRVGAIDRRSIGVKVAAEEGLVTTIGVKDRRVVTIEDLPQRLGLSEEIKRLKRCVGAWAEQSDPEMRETLRWQLLSRSKYFRPLTIFACHRAVNNRPPTALVLRSAVALELFHNVSLIIDDILDHSRYRRGKFTLHCRYGILPALMTSGYLTAGGFKMVASDGYSVRLLAELMQRLGVAERLQWRVRRRPLGVEDWRVIAGEDTGSTFEVCAQLGTRNDRLRMFGRLLGILYHGCDDVGDLRGGAALGGGGNDDLDNGILTLPAAIAIRDPAAAMLFHAGGRKHKKILMGKTVAALPEAERYLDEIAKDAEKEARQCAKNPLYLIELVRHTRALASS